MMIDLKSLGGISRGKLKETLLEWKLPSSNNPDLKSEGKQPSICLPLPLPGKYINFAAATKVLHCPQNPNLPANHLYRTAPSFI